MALVFGTYMAVEYLFTWGFANPQPEWYSRCEQVPSHNSSIAFIGRGYEQVRVQGTAVGHGEHNTKVRVNGSGCEGGGYWYMVYIPRTCTMHKISKTVPQCSRAIS